MPKHHFRTARGGLTAQIRVLLQPAIAGMSFRAGWLLKFTPWEVRDGSKNNH